MSYSTTLGRWIQQDYGGGYVDGADLYKLEEDSPINNRDASGLFTSTYHAQQARFAGAITMMNGQYIDELAWNDVFSDFEKVFVPWHHGQSSRWVKWTSEILQDMAALPNDPSYAATAVDYLAYAMHPVQDFFSHTDWVEGNKMEALYQGSGDGGAFIGKSVNNRPHGSGELDVNAIANGNSSQVSGTVYYSGGIFDFLGIQSAHSLYGADAPGKGRDGFLGQLAGLTGAFDRANDGATHASVDLIEWAKIHMPPKIRCQVFYG